MNLTPLMWHLIQIILIYSNYINYASCKGDDSPGFLLRINKNIPRLGRQADYQMSTYDSNKYFNTMNKQSLWNDASQVDSILYERSIDSELSSAHQLALVQPLNIDTDAFVQLIDNEMLQNVNMKFIPWKALDMALQFDNEFYMKMISLGRRTDKQLKSDLLTFTKL